MSEKEPFHFTLGRLIEVLKSLPQDLPVLTSGYEGGFENFYEPCIIKVRHELEIRIMKANFRLLRMGMRKLLRWL